MAPTPLVLPQASAFLPLKTVVSGSVTLFLPAPGMTPPWMPRAVPLPPASPCATAILPWAATRGVAARRNVRRDVQCIFEAKNLLDVDRGAVKAFVLHGDRNWGAYESIVGDE